MEKAPEEFVKRLRLAGQPDAVVEAFSKLYGLYRAGDDGCVPWREVSRPDTGDILDFDEVKGRAADLAAYGKTVWILLNGGLGTSMQMEGPKSLLKVKGGSTFLDLIARHALRLRAATGVNLPVLFMNSSGRSVETLDALRTYPLEVEGLPLSFEQHLFPRIREADGQPYGEAGSENSLAPPGHGDLYLALAESGLLRLLLSKGYEWAFISNADNLGASPTPFLPGWLKAGGYDFVMEVTPKTRADIKGGTLVRRGGRLTLLEVAQVCSEDMPGFVDTSLFPAFNTNNLWLNLPETARLLESKTLHMPLIVNRKKLDQTPFVQLEQAVGAGISSFRNPRGLLVPRSRFAPVKTTGDLLVRSSDAYVEGEESPLVPSPKGPRRDEPVKVELDPRYFCAAADLYSRFAGPLSLAGARSLTVRGNVYFGKDVKILGDAVVENDSTDPLVVPDGAVLGGG